MIVLTNKKRQQGVVLAISLIMLLLLTLIGITGMQVTGLEEKMAGNYRDQSLAFQSAESALRAGEKRIEQLRNNGAGSIQSFCNGTAGLFYRQGVTGCTGCVTPACPTPKANNLATWTDNNTSVEYATGSTLVASQPRYFISYTSQITDVDLKGRKYVFMVTARGTGGQDSSEVVLRSYYGGKSQFQP
ncbi:MAG TPA: pilus assembly protein PilX [Methyloprofundus sp.]|uniref:pilus assembly PilX family protein n=1 Tax=Methyloprofundus sp. TaxID=2020875 RepID=UPI00183BC510|nr:PilX N-terminal domain-containing pilus assembly protein [Methyloprofundus sp.]HIG65420.1 pilus assembly protein PilX [Methyloprofundus sp.]HIL78237.1 pilus assembly protein PilX [Methylococcales bacterium]